jgi:hypothetical protein
VTLHVIQTCTEPLLQHNFSRKFGCRFGLRASAWRCFRSAMHIADKLIRGGGIRGSHRGTVELMRAQLVN